MEQKDHKAPPKFVERYLREQTEVGNRTAKAVEALEATADWGDSAVFGALDALIDDWADEVFEAVTKQRKTANEHEWAASQIEQRASTIRKLAEQLRERSDLPTTQGEPTKIDQLVTTVALRAYAGAEQELLPHLERFLKQADQVITQLKTEARFEKLEHHAEFPDPGQTVFPKGQRGRPFQPEHFRLWTLVNLLGRALESREKAVQHVSERVCRRWMALEGEAARAGSPLSAAQFADVWGPKVTRKMVDEDRIQKLEVRFSQAARRVEGFFKQSSKTRKSPPTSE